ncbi:MAG TPA: RNA polymerase sigma factor [Tissierellia bacterium]|nr:RNA polymerase sigma factor [Tissierellia bacterium]
MYPVIIMFIEDDRDRKFMEQLYEEYYLLMRKKAYEIVMDDSVVDDIINDTIIRLIKYIDTIKKLECHKLTSYIVYTVRSVSIDFINKKSRHNKRMFYGLDNDLSETIEDTEAPQPDEFVIIGEEIDELGKAISRLSEIDQEILFYKYNLEMSTTDIASIFNISKDNVCKRLQRARQRVLKELKKAGHNVE